MAWLTPDLAVAVLTFLAGVFALALSMTNLVPANIAPWVQFSIGVINLALTVFFGAKKPIQAVRARAAAAARK